MPSVPISSWIKAFRLRTLPLALSSILMGSFLAIHDQPYSWGVIVLAILTTILLQILSNLANDYGDSQKGTDNINRLGPERTVQSGEISPRQMKRGIIVFVILSLLSGLLLLYFSFKEDFLPALVFLAIGIGAIAAAIKYTVGKRAYGYVGFGDLFVLLFFGFAGVMGTYYLNTHTFEWEVLLPAFSLGFLSVGVLNLNNMRDIDNDISSGKHTLASRLGLRNARVYHAFLIVGALLTALLYVWLNYSSPWNFMFLLAAIPIIRDLVVVFSIKEQRMLDPYLKKLALSTLLFTVLFGVGILM
jgi:1,4-dihydroxy-2-naphthoate octaprenyltransferase